MADRVWPRGGLASVIVHCAGPVARTGRSLDAVLRKTRRPWELILVAGAGSGLTDYLEGVARAATVHAEVVDESTGKGLPHSAGIAAARGDYLALIDDRTIVADGWLQALSALADRVALAGPMYGNMAAKRIGPEVRRGWIATDRLDPSCVVARRSVFEDLADPQAPTIDDLAECALGRGLIVAIDPELHLGRNPADIAQPRFPAVPRRPARTIPPGLNRPAIPDFAPCKSGIEGSSESAPALISNISRQRPSRKPRVSLTMIVRDEEDQIGPCLQSAGDLFDEIIVVDTGSTDATAEVARSLGATVVPFAWVDDFSAARNAAIDHASGRYAFWLDADDRLDESARDALRSLLAGLDDAEPAAHVVRQVSAEGAGRGVALAADHVRLFPIQDDVRWRYRVHEQILPAIEAADLPLRWTDIAIAHLGYVDAELASRKVDRNVRLLGLDLIERPGDPVVLFHLGWAALTRSDALTAEGYLRASIAACSPGDGVLRKAYSLLAEAHALRGDLEAAIDACLAGRSSAGDDPGLLFAEAAHRQALGDEYGAERCLRLILQGAPARGFAVGAEGIRGHLTHRRLAALAERRGDRASALGHWRSVLAERPDDPEAKSARARLSISRAG